jgi:hypothetical protein
MPATSTYKTPGVYVAEIPAFPPSVVGVATAIPVFVGYTEKAEIAGKPVYYKPIPIGSLADYEEVFGRGYKAVYNLEEVPRSSPDGGEPDDYDFRVFDSSGSPAGYVYYKLTAATPVASLAGAETAAFALGGVVGEEPAPDQPRFNLYNSLRLFYANGGGNGYVVSVGSYAGAVNGVEMQPLLDGLTAASEQVGPTMIVVPDAVLLPPTEADVPWVSSDFEAVATAMLKQASTLGDRVAILDVYGAQYVNTSDHEEATLPTVIGAFQTAVGETGLSYGMAYFPFLDTTVIPLSDVDYTNLNNADGTLTDILEWENTNLYNTPPVSPPSARYTMVQGLIDAMATTPSDDKAAVTKLNNNLLAALPLLKAIELQVIGENDVLPPSGAMAGVFTRVDATSGVWNAPANVTLASVLKPTLRLDNAQQEDLNMPVNGKAIDALRAFPGRGTVVWGARTLAGNSPDYRYIQVRRTLIYIEQSIKAALDPFVFAPNTGQTWATVVAMVSGFLQGVWAQGGLMGATPAEAFTVQCGLGSTMTGTDVLNGYMIVQVTLSLIRPAEFIEITFKQTMQGVG